MAGHIIGVVRLVRQQNRRFVTGHRVKGRVQVGGPAQDIIDTREPEPAAVGFNRSRLIGEDLNSPAAQRACDNIWIGREVVISRNRPQAVRSLHLPEQVGARFGGHCCSSVIFVSPEDRRGDEISGNCDQVGAKTVDQADRRMKGMLGKIGVVVEVAEQRDRESVHLGRPAAKSDILAHDARTIGLDENRVGGDGGDSSNRRETNELPSVSGK